MSFYIFIWHLFPAGEFNIRLSARQNEVIFYNNKLFTKGTLLNSGNEIG